jgi:hypothetical protein
LAATATGAKFGSSRQVSVGVDGVCVLRYDNEAVKGDHRHVKDKEEPYNFTDPDTLLGDFWRDVEEWSR